ncbi:MAG: phosphoribosylanthranilate isomerase [Gammaproteobacteria bacterium]|nr:phosphoribosylanthranilate isomerase [Gammaproteobacteria bacterium]
MSVLVKICGLKEKRHVELAVESGAGAVGFVFAESPRRITPDAANAASDTVPDHVKRVAVMLHPANEEWLEVLERFGPDVLQTDAADFERLDVPDGVERWPVFRAGQSEPATSAAYVYEGPKSGSGETVDWSLAAELARRGRMVLAGGLHAGNVGRAIETVRPFGVDVSSGVETSPGEKDAQLIAEFIRAARAAEKNL